MENLDVKNKETKTSIVNAINSGNAEELADKTHSEIVRVIGSKFILYKKNPQKKDNVIPTKTTRTEKK